jgi:TonB family protein
MKTILFLFSIISVNAFAQSNTGNAVQSRTVYCESFNIHLDDLQSSTGVMPIFTGDSKESDLKKWICANAVYPEQALADDKMGNVFVSFVVLPDGTVDDVQITNSTDRVFNEETLKLLSRMPKWIPAKCNGAAVPVKISDLRISYALN